MKEFDKNTCRWTATVRFAPGYERLVEQYITDLKNISPRDLAAQYFNELGEKDYSRDIFACSYKGLLYMFLDVFEDDANFTLDDVNWLDLIYELYFTCIWDGNNLENEYIFYGYGFCANEVVEGQRECLEEAFGLLMKSPVVESYELEVRAGEEIGYVCPVCAGSNIRQEGIALIFFDAVYSDEQEDVDEPEIIDIQQKKNVYYCGDCGAGPYSYKFVTIPV